MASNVEENKGTNWIVTLVSMTISIGFLIGGGIAYGVYDHQCTTFPDQCNETQRFASFVIMCVGGAFTACNCLCLFCMLSIAGVALCCEGCNNA